ncbi:hypothetical protein BIY37_11755 [Candidatus Brocadia sapporoensis]|uniref:Uncharacterized protein n=1 Tax=Candidatus Brocadia sapporoensis TaxID=392547 RepID=A0A1V6LXB0_9BACT|nr:hypothetical protein [Candidatus Brocadia sapporoensis]MBE7447294.1 hypothetical protein [Planctomycetia bacterium]OQD44778.1 hypothetical protein BIY37_11755 [Candidatus Brocadia sapporoensis]GJQ22615.1 MAG: hypothetical protein HBSAPP01_04050 [Candidatus Brocadia sapporoensis]
MLACEKTYLGICFITPPSGLESSIFGFTEFISALALLVIVYTVTDIRYRFRVAVAPIPLFPLTYLLIGFIGFGTLLTDVWFSERWLIPNFLANQAGWQGMFGAFFLLLVMIWMYYAVINPPIFCKKNYRKFAKELYKVILKGSESDLPVIADELARSAEHLVKLSRQNPPRWQKDTNKKEEQKRRKPNVGDYAYDILLLIGNRKLCRHIVASSPVTAMVFFEAMASNEKYDLPIGQFSRNISTEAIINKDSILYHEDEGYSSGLIGYLKPFSKAIYGNYRLVEALGSKTGSTLDIHHEILWSWDASQLEAYSRAVMITLKSYLESGNWTQHPFALYRALENIKNSCCDVYKLNDISSDYYSTDIFKRLQTVVRYVKYAIDLIGKQQNVPSTTLRVRGDQMHEDIYDHVANLMFEIIFSAASVTAPPDKCWTIHYNSVWYEFFGLSDKGKAWKIIRFKLRRLLYDEILRLEKFPNYKSSKILGFCLNVMGLKIREEKEYDSECYPLHKSVLAWTRNNYLRLKNIQPEVANSCLIGSIGFDEHGNRLVKIYAKGLNLEAPKEYLELASANNEHTR